MSYISLVIIAELKKECNQEDNSSSLAKVKRLVVVVNGCGSLAQEGGRSSLGCGHDADVSTSAYVCVQPVQEHVRTEAVSNGQANDSFVESMLAMSTLFLLRTVVARSELLLLCMYGARA